MAGDVERKAGEDVFRQIFGHSGAVEGQEDEPAVQETGAEIRDAAGEEGLGSIGVGEPAEGLRVVAIAVTAHFVHAVEKEDETAGVRQAADPGEAGRALPLDEEQDILRIDAPLAFFDMKLAQPQVENGAGGGAPDFTAGQGEGGLLEGHGLTAAGLSQEDEGGWRAVEGAQDVADLAALAIDGGDLGGGGITSLRAADDLQEDLMDWRDKGVPVLGIGQRTARNFAAGQRQMRFSADRGRCESRGRGGGGR